MKKCCTYLVLVTLCWLFLAGTVLRQQALASKLIRIHVLAASDSAEDQAVKLQVRDAVLRQLSELTEHCADRKDAAAVMISHADLLGKTAANTAGRQVSLQLSPESYGTRHYETFSLPAGEYLSLQIRIGEGNGKNWWCVAFPMVCMAATAEELEAAAVSAGIDGGELRLMTGEETDIEVRFIVLEWLASLKERFFS